MSLDRILNGQPKSHFVRDHFHRLPFSQAGGAAWLSDAISWTTVAETLQSVPDLLVAREGQLNAGSPPATLEDLRSRLSDGETIVLRHAEQHFDVLSGLAGGFLRDLNGPIDAQMFMTGGGRPGFSWHYDAEDVFAIQLQGRKEYSLRKNTVNPWPVLEAMPQNMRYERELMPLAKVELWPGDWLYIPCGYWHSAEVRGTEDSLTVALGVMSPSALSVLDVARQQLTASMLWRQRLPVTGEARDLDEQELKTRYRELLSDLAVDIARVMTSEHFLARVLEARP